MHRAEPAKAPLGQRGHVHETSTLQDLDVGDFVLQPDVQRTPKAAEVEPVESPLLSGIGRPRPLAVKENRQDISLVATHLGPFARQVISPHLLVEFGYGSG